MTAYKFYKIKVAISRANLKYVLIKGSMHISIESISNGLATPRITFFRICRQNPTRIGLHQPGDKLPPN